MVCRPLLLIAGYAAFVGSSSIALAHDVVPSLSTIQRLETQNAFWGDAADIGLPGVVSASEAGHRWRVKARNPSCEPAEALIICRYETKPCVWEKSPLAAKSWCVGERQFRRANSFRSIDGWEFADKPCREIMGGTQGAHPIRRDCPALNRSVQNSIAIIAENGKRAGKQCKTGIAYLRNGGRADRLEDYACAPDKTPSTER